MSALEEAMRTFRLPLLAWIVWTSVPGEASTGDGGKALSIFWENDQRNFRGCPPKDDRARDPITSEPLEGCEDSDRYYTNGVKLELSWTGGLGVPDAFRFGRRGLSWTKAIVLGQTMYTPDNIGAPAFQPNDRPYGGWLYAGLQGKATGVAQQHTLEIQLGCTGRCALGGPVQRAVHRFINVTEPEGWPHQIRSRVGFLVMYEGQAKPIRGNTFDAAVLGRAVAGNIFTSATVGSTARLGWNLEGAGFDPGSGPGTVPNLPGIDPHAPWPPGSPLRAVSPARPAVSDPFLYTFGRAIGSAVGYNVFLQAEPSRVSPKRFVGTFESGIGGGVTLHGVRLQLVWRNVWRTGEFVGQPKGHQFGSFHLIVD